jgi:hypothetical protein
LFVAVCTLFVVHRHTQSCHHRSLPWSPGRVCHGLSLFIVVASLAFLRCRHCSASMSLSVAV